MTKETTRPAGLKAGPLVGQDLSLLKAGSSVLRGDVQRDLWTYEEHNDRFLFLLSLDIRPAWTERGQPGRKEWAADVRAVTYVGECDEDGWIAAPEEGWPGNPVPGLRVEIRARKKQWNDTGASSDYEWRYGRHSEDQDIIAFRPTPEARPSDPFAVEAEGVGEGDVYGDGGATMPDDLRIFTATPSASEPAAGSVGEAVRRVETALETFRGCDRVKVDHGDLRTILAALSTPAPSEEAGVDYSLDLILELATRGADKAGCDGWRAQEMCRQIANLLKNSRSAALTGASSK